MVLIELIKKIICTIIAIIFYIFGLIGIMIPVVPQVPFLVIGTIFLIIGYKSIKHKIIKNKYYLKYCKRYVDKYSFLKQIMN